MNQDKIRRTKRLQGIVLKNTMDKTVVVRVERSFKHPGVFRIVKDSKKYYAHDHQNDCQVGDEVIIAETRPLSRMKRWRAEKILRRAVLINEEAESGDIK